MQHIQARLDEICAQLEARDLSRSTRRILDLFLDFNLSRSLKADATELRAEYNEFSASEKQLQTEAAFNALLARAHALLQQIERALLPTQVTPVAPENTTTQRISSEKTIVCKAQSLTKTYTSRGVHFHLPPVDLHLYAGEITGIVGENGNGKTTLLRMLAGDLEPSGGNVSYPQFGVSNWYDIKQHIAYIPQHITPWVGALKTNLLFTAAVHGVPTDIIEEQVDFVIHRLGLTKYEDANWSEISGGYKLRFELARAIVWKPSLLIIDEPLAHLDINAQQIFIQDIRYLAQSEKFPMSVFISSQHLHEMESISDNILFIKNGELLYNGKMQDFAQDRTQNQYELTTTASYAALCKALESIEEIKVDDVGQTKVIHTPISLTPAKLFSLLGAHNIDVQYFRDISTSTLKLFKDH